MIVSNTTPISNLLHLDNISLLAELFGTVYIPEAVANELNVVFLSSGEWQKCIEGEQIIIQSISNTIFVKQMVPFLHQGEAEAICLSLEKKAKLCLIDDKDALIDKLRAEHHFWIREDMYQKVLHIAKEKALK